MTRQIAISIIIPNYNSGQYLRECVDSIGNYDNNKIEVIIIDDGSSDGSERLIDNDNVTIIKSNKNMGVSHSRNKGIDIAKGKYIFFIDADDKLTKAATEELLKWTHSNDDIIYFSKNNLNEKKSELLKQIMGTNNDGICIAGAVSKLYKKSFLKQKNIKFHEDIINGEDMIFNIEALTKTNKYRISNQGIYLYRRNYNSATRTFNKRIMESDKAFHSYIKQLLSDQYVKDISILAINGLFTIINRISFLPITRAMTEYRTIDLDFYKNFKESIQSLSGFRRLIIRLFLDGNYKIVHNLLVFSRNASDTMRHNKKYTTL